MDIHQSLHLPMKQNFYGKYSTTVENSEFEKHDCKENLAYVKADNAIRTKKEKYRKITWTPQATHKVMSFPFCLGHNNSFHPG